MAALPACKGDTGFLTQKPNVGVAPLHGVSKAKICTHKTYVLSSDLRMCMRNTQNWGCSRLVWLCQGLANPHPGTPIPRRVLETCLDFLWSFHLWGWCIWLTIPMRLSKTPRRSVKSESDRPFRGSGFGQNDVGLRVAFLMHFPGLVFRNCCPQRIFRHLSNYKFFDFFRASTE